MPRAGRIPPLLDRRDVYAAERARAARAARPRTTRARVYVPNSRVEHGRRDLPAHRPRSSTTSRSARCRSTSRRRGTCGRCGSPTTRATASRRSTRAPAATGAPVPVADPYNLYFTADGRRAIVVAEAHRAARLPRRRTRCGCATRCACPQCAGVDHMDFTADGRCALVSCEFARPHDRRRPARASASSRRSTLRAGAMPQDVKLSPDGRTFYVADMASNGVWLIDARTLRARSASSRPARARTASTRAATRGACSSPTAARARSRVISFRTRRPIAQVAPARRRLARTWAACRPTAACCGCRGRYDAEVYAISTRTGRLLHRIQVGQRPARRCASGRSPAATRSGTPASCADARLKRALAAVVDPLRMRAVVALLLLALALTGCGARRQAARGRSPTSTAAPARWLRPSAANEPQVRAATLCLINAQRARHGDAAADREPAARPRGRAALARHGQAQVLRARRPRRRRTPTRGSCTQGYPPILVGENLAWGETTKSTPAWIVSAVDEEPGPPGQHPRAGLPRDRHRHGLPGARGAAGAEAGGDLHDDVRRRRALAPATAPAIPLRDAGGGRPGAAVRRRRRARRPVVRRRAGPAVRLRRAQRRRQDDDDADRPRRARARRAARCAGAAGRSTRATRARFGYMPEERGLYPKMRVRDQLAYFARLHGAGAPRRAAAADALARAARARRARAATASRRSRSATSSACSSPPRSCTTRSCSCSTSRSPASTRSASTCSAACCASAPTAACRCCSPRTSSSSSSGSASRWRSSRTGRLVASGRGRRPARARRRRRDRAGRGGRRRARTGSRRCRAPRSSTAAPTAVLVALRRRRRRPRRCSTRRARAGHGHALRARAADAERAVPRGGGGVSGCAAPGRRAGRAPRGDAAAAREVVPDLDGRDHGDHRARRGDPAAAGRGRAVEVHDRGDRRELRADRRRGAPRARRASTPSSKVRRLSPAAARRRRWTRATSTPSCRPAGCGRRRSPTTSSPA